MYVCMPSEAPHQVEAALDGNVAAVLQVQCILVTPTSTVALEEEGSWNRPTTLEGQ